MRGSREPVARGQNKNDHPPGIEDTCTGQALKTAQVRTLCGNEGLTARELADLVRGNAGHVWRR